MRRRLTLTSDAERRGQVIDLDNPNNRASPTAQNFTDPAVLRYAPAVIQTAHEQAVEAFTAWRAAADALGTAWEDYERAPGRQVDVDRQALADGDPMPKVDHVRKAREQLDLANRREHAAHAHAAERFEAYHRLAVEHHREWHEAQAAAAREACERLLATIEQMPDRVSELQALAGAVQTLHNFAGHRGERLHFERPDRAAAAARKLRETATADHVPGPRGFVPDYQGPLMAALRRSIAAMLPAGPPAIEVERDRAAQREQRAAEREGQQAEHIAAANEREARRQERLRNAA